MSKFSFSNLNSEFYHTFDSVFFFSSHQKEFFLILSSTIFHFQGKVATILRCLLSCKTIPLFLSHYYTWNLCCSSKIQIWHFNYKHDSFSNLLNPLQIYGICKNMLNVTNTIIKLY